MAKMDWSDRTPEYRSWGAMLSRCRNPKDTNYPRYGGRGISVCRRWHVFENFFADMGLRPSSGHSLERDDNDKGYEIGNCRWATRAEQARNRSSNSLNLAKVKFIRDSAGSLTQTEIARIIGTSQAHVSRVILRQTWADV